MKLQYTPIQVEESTNGSLDVYVQDVAAEVSEEEAIYACWHCLARLTTVTYHTECTAQ